MRRLLVCLLLLAFLGAACSSGGDDDAAENGDATQNGDDPTAPTEGEDASADTEAYCAKVEELVAFFDDNVDPDLPPDEARAAFMVEFEDEVVALFVEAGSLAPPEIGGAFSAVLNSADNAEEAQAELEEFNQEECGVDTSALNPGTD